MNSNSKFTGFALLILSIVVLISGFIMGNAIKSIERVNSDKTSNELVVYNLSQVADYLNMTEKQVKSIIRAEENQLHTTGSFNGTMFPFFTIDDELYFYKEVIDQWLYEVSINRRNYDTKDNKVTQ